VVPRLQSSPGMRLSKESVLALIAASLVAVGLPGCGDGCAIGYQQGAVKCSTGGTVSSTVSAGITPPKPVQVSGGLTCAMPGGGCDYGPSFGVATTGELVSQGEVNVQFDLPPSVASGSFTLPSKKVQMMGTFRGAALRIVSGTIGLEAASQAGFVSPFDVVLATPDGTQLTLTGRAEISNCQLDSMCGVL
jgi:hypothetical protein